MALALISALHYLAPHPRPPVRKAKTWTHGLAGRLMHAALLAIGVGLGRSI